MAEVREANPDDVDALVNHWLELTKTHERLDPRFKLVKKAKAIWREHILSAMPIKIPEFWLPLRLYVITDMFAVDMLAGNIH